MEQLRENLKRLYHDFFVDMKIDQQTGIVNGTNRRFTGYPYIGGNYINAPVKILFIPLDVGVDERENENTYHTFESRKDIFPSGKLDFNPHIAGLYATALYILKEKMGLQAAWDALWGNRKYNNVKAINLAYDSLPKDLMSYVAYENRFRFVTIGRKERSGGNDRVWINPKREGQLLVTEINAFSPDIIVFQGKYGLGNCHIDELKEKYKVVIAYHPSCWQHRANRLEYIVDHIGPQLL